MHRFFDQTESPIIGRFSRRALFLAAIASVPAIGAAIAAPAVSPDPLVDAIAEYNARAAEFAAIPSDLIDMGNEEAFVAATYGPAFDRLWKDCPAATSLQGVAEAIRYALKENCICSSSAENVLKSALAFLDGERAS
ncbi:hypothetical protein D3227_28050 [Mesorhizobium waimense]|uniref:Uncharacterized protein n=2 Tax=Mesorhizobium waimense TaxID=1300307 RepID=A0A3A5KGU4_9HYPH|nr:hypothetical protein D3227_28050 [Mesorhizobium waimense]